MEKSLQPVLEFARNAHGRQKRKYANELYIEHPIRVMKICQEYSQHLPLLSAALLHDVLEDTEVDQSGLKEFLSGIMSAIESTETLQLVVELTDVYTSEDYPGWNRKKRKQKESERLAATSKNAQTIKYADIIDNSRDVVNTEHGFAKIYLHEGLQLLNVMTAGDRELYEVALKMVNDCSHKLNFRHHK